jgi:hypothetical protein
MRLTVKTRNRGTCRHPAVAHLGRKPQVLIQKTMAAMQCVVSLTLVAMLARVWLVEGIQNPCHPLSIKNNPASCTKVTLPSGICNACTMGDITAGGHYLQCTHTMHIQNAQCEAKLLQYVGMNPCDTARAQAWTEYHSADSATKEIGRMKLDHYMYSICEQSK